MSNSTKIDWSAFDRGRLCVGFHNEEAYDYFLKECEERGYMWVSGKLPTEGFEFTYDKLVYCCGGNKLALGADEDRRKTKIVALPHYTLNRLIKEGKEGVYENDSCVVRVGKHEGILSIESKEEGFIYINDNDLFYPVEMKLIFSEALQAYNEGKTIRSLKTFRAYNIVEARKWQGEMVRFSEINSHWEIVD